jgi:hypothetical protein
MSVHQDAGEKMEQAAANYGMECEIKTLPSHCFKLLFNGLVFSWTGDKSGLNEKN